MTFYPVTYIPAWQQWFLHPLHTPYTAHTYSRRRTHTPRGCCTSSQISLPRDISVNTTHGHIYILAMLNAKISTGLICQSYSRSSKDNLWGWLPSNTGKGLRNRKIKRPFLITTQMTMLLVAVIINATVNSQNSCQKLFHRQRHWQNREIKNYVLQLWQILRIFNIFSTRH